MIWLQTKHFMNEYIPKNRMCKNCDTLLLSKHFTMISDNKSTSTSFYLLVYGKGIWEKQRKKRKQKWKKFVKEMMWVAYALGRRIVCLLSLKMEERRKCERDCFCQTWSRFTNILWQKTLLWKLDSVHLPCYDQSGVYQWDHLGHTIYVYVHITKM